MKPANIMLTENGQAVLMDFGVAKILGGTQHTATGMVRDACLAAEAAGWDSLWIDDHLLADEGDPSDPKFEGWSTLAALAVLTARPRLGLLVAANTVNVAADLAYSRLSLQAGYQADTMTDAMIYYLDTFAERVHHPKEDQYLFGLLRQRSDEAGALIAEELLNSHSYRGRSVFGWEPAPGEGDASGGERAVTA